MNLEPHKHRATTQVVQAFPKYDFNVQLQQIIEALHTDRRWRRRFIEDLVGSTAAFSPCSNFRAAEDRFV